MSEPCMLYEDLPKGMRLIISDESIRSNRESDTKESKEVVQMSETGKFIKEHASIREAARNVPGCHASAISNCCNGKIRFKTHNKFTWKFKEDYIGN